MMRWLGAVAALHAFREHQDRTKRPTAWSHHDTLALIATNVRKHMTDPRWFLRPTEEDITKVIAYGHENFREYLSDGLRDLNQLQTFFDLLNQDAVAS